MTSYSDEEVKEAIDWAYEIGSVKKSPIKSRIVWAAEQYLKAKEDAARWVSMPEAETRLIEAVKVIEHYAKHGGDYDCTSKIAEEFLNNK